MMEILTNVGTAYDTISASKGLGWGLIDFTGITQITMAIKVSKVGSGTQTWQLWNDTDSAEIGAIADSGATGDKVLEQTFTGLVLTGVKRIRIRCKSTTASDDPIYYSGSVLAK